MFVFQMQYSTQINVFVHWASPRFQSREHATRDMYQIGASGVKLDFRHRSCYVNMSCSTLGCRVVVAASLPYANLPSIVSGLESSISSIMRSMSRICDDRSTVSGVFVGGKSVVETMRLCGDVRRSLAGNSAVNGEGWEDVGAEI